MLKSCALLVMFVACGNSSAQNESVGQVKKVIKRTPIICGDYVEADISLGVVRNGIGSMSHEDLLLYVQNQSDIDTLKHAADSGDIVKFTYDVRRFTWCTPDHWLTSVAIDTTPSDASKRVTPEAQR
jgi:hypothetical protein